MQRMSVPHLGELNTNQGEHGITALIRSVHWAAWTEEESGGEWTHVYAWLRPFAVHLKLSQHH